MASYAYPLYYIMTKVLPGYKTFIAKVLCKNMAKKKLKFSVIISGHLTGAWLGWN
jgi:hypothetical protein